MSLDVTYALSKECEPRFPCFINKLWRSFMTCALFTSLLLTVESKQSYMAMWSGDVKCTPLSEYTSDILVYIIDMVSVIYTIQIKFYFTNSFIALSHINVNINSVTYILEKNCIQWTGYFSLVSTSSSSVESPIGRSKYAFYKCIMRRSSEILRQGRPCCR